MNQERRRIGAWVWAAAGLLAATAGAGADPLPNFAQAAVNPNFSGGSGPDEHDLQLPGTLDVAASATGGGGSSGSGSSHVQYGLVRLHADAVGSVNTVVRGFIRDRFTITAPGIPTGTQGTLVFSVNVSGAMVAGSGASASSWSLQADVGGGIFDMNRGGHQYSPELGGGSTGDPFGTFTSGVVSFTFGRATTMDVELSGSAQAGNGSDGAHGSASFAAPVVLVWGGLSDLHANGSPVGTFSVSSESGTDWGSPVSACPADFNGDGFLDFFDYDDFVNCFESGSCPPGATADFNGDGFADFFDYDGFVQAFEVGC